MGFKHTFVLVCIWMSLALGPGTIALFAIGSDDAPTFAALWAGGIVVMSALGWWQDI